MHLVRIVEKLLPKYRPGLGSLVRFDEPELAAVVARQVQLPDVDVVDPYAKVVLHSALLVVDDQRRDPRPIGLVPAGMASEE